MKFCRFGDDRLGVVEGAFVRDVTPALDTLPACQMILGVAGLVELASSFYTLHPRDIVLAARRLASVPWHRTTGWLPPSMESGQ